MMQIKDNWNQLFLIGLLLGRVVVIINDFGNLLNKICFFVWFVSFKIVVVIKRVIESLWEKFIVRFCRGRQIDIQLFEL